MGFVVKTLLVILVIAVAGGFIINQAPALKQRVIEVINPAAKEGRLLGELKTNLDEINNNINGLDASKTPQDLRDKIQKSKNLLEQSRGLLSNISEINQKNSGIIKQQVSKIIDALTDRTPYPADHLKVTVTASSSAAVCPPAK